jgi:predicted ATPase/DNA-binding CsgD family transcriptional regulator
VTQEASAVAAGGTHGLPIVLTSFIGRAGETAELARLLDEYRLVTVTGPAGAGKTRLAGEVARRTAGRFADGVWLAELARVEDPTLVAVAVAAAVGFSPAAGAPVVESLADVLARRQLLLVLDNCEHVLTAVAQLCGVLLVAADDVRVLATSRAPLGVPGEARYRLPPLSLPRPGEEASLAESEAVSLFTDRARRVDPQFAPGPEVGAVVARLDGMPLAIELAAAWVEALGMAQLLAGLDDRFGLLETTHPAAAGRQQSLAAAVEWSYRLLGDHEQAVFRWLAAFPGPFTLEGALALGGTNAMHAVLRLVDCSLLDPPRTGPDGRSRYRMLETLRAYGMARLAEAGEQQRAADVLARYAIGVAEQATAGLEISTAELAALQWLDAEDATMHHVLRWALGHEPDMALRLAIALAPWWSLRGRYVTGYDLLSGAARSGPQDGQGWCTAQVLLGRLATGIDEVAGLEHYTAVKDRLAGHGPSQILVQALAGRAGCLVNLGRLPEAVDEAGRALELATTLAYPAGEARALFWLGGAANYAGDHVSCLAWWRRAQQIDPAAIPGSLVRRCGVALGIALVDAGALDEARETCARVLRMARQAGAVFDQADGLLLMANIDLSAGRLPEVRAAMNEAVKLVAELGQDALVVDCLDVCGHLCAQAGRPAEAITAWSARAALRQAMGMPDPPADVKRRQEPLRRAGQAAGSERERAEHRGAVMTLNTAAEFAALLISSEAPEPAQTAGTVGALGLSARERELVTLVAQGRTNAQIAGQLFISVRTVGSHLDRIRDKTGCRRRADLTRLALQAGLV